jgi:hypothetical protein
MDNLSVKQWVELSVKQWVELSVKQWVEFSVKQASSDGAHKDPRRTLVGRHVAETGRKAS